ncbi:hypothetical protein Droror1_Dr00020241, partial [Drosera rotundifolia]
MTVRMNKEPNSWRRVNWLGLSMDFWVDDGAVGIDVRVVVLFLIFGELRIWL